MDSKMMTMPLMNLWQMYAYKQLSKSKLICILSVEEL